MENVTEMSPIRVPTTPTSHDAIVGSPAKSPLKKTSPKKGKTMMKAKTSMKVPKTPMKVPKTPMKAKTSGNSKSSRNATAPAAGGTHPPYAEMIVNAINSIGEGKAVSKRPILKYILASYTIAGSENAVNAHLRASLKRLVANGQLMQVKGIGASGSFRVPAIKGKKRVTKKEVIATPDDDKTVGQTKKPRSKKITESKASPKKTVGKSKAKGTAASASAGAPVTPKKNATGKTTKRTPQKVKATGTSGKVTKKSPAAKPKTPKSAKKSPAKKVASKTLKKGAQIAK